MLIASRPFRSVGGRYTSAACLLCRWRSFSTSYRRLAEKEPSATPSPPHPPPPSPLEGAPRSYGKSVTEFTPKPLNRPIGLPHRPRPGENWGIDKRTLQQRRDDFVDYDKHLIRRKELTKKMATPYFREWSNMRLHKGKSFFAPPRLFKAERALYFPNLYGQTLVKPKTLQDTTPVLENKISVVSLFSSAWAENQAATFTSEKSNRELREVIKKSGGDAQMVQINLEDNWLKAMIIKLFMYRLRKILGRENWGRYFLVQRGLTDEIRDLIGHLNSKVGYTYLLDGECKIRWAASGPAEGDEADGLVKGVQRLLDDAKIKKRDAAAAAALRQVPNSAKEMLIGKDKEGKAAG